MKRGRSRTKWGTSCSINRGTGAQPRSGSTVVAHGRRRLARGGERAERLTVDECARIRHESGPLAVPSLLQRFDEARPHARAAEFRQWPARPPYPRPESAPDVAQRPAQVRVERASAAELGVSIEPRAIVSAYPRCQWLGITVEPGRTVGSIRSWPQRRASTLRARSRASSRRSSRARAARESAESRWTGSNSGLVDGLFR